MAADGMTAVGDITGGGVINTEYVKCGEGAIQYTW